MAEKFLRLLNGRVMSDPGALGGFLGDGDLLTNDGDASGYEAWNVGSNIGDPPGDSFEYDVEPANLPAGAVITGYQAEWTWRVVEADPQGYTALPMMSTHSPTGGFHSTMLGTEGTPGSLPHEYHDGWRLNRQAIDADIDAAFRAGTATVRLGTDARTASEILTGIRVTLAGIRLFYEATTTQRRAHNRIVQRGNDGLGLTGGQRVVQRRTIQSSNRVVGIR